MTDDMCVLHEIQKETGVRSAEDAPSLPCVTPCAPDKQRFQAEGSSPRDLFTSKHIPPPHTSDIL